MAQIGTVKLDTQNSGVVDVPVFETGDSASGIYEFVRVETASGAGFIPVTDPADATYPYLRVQSQNNGIVAVTDTPGSAIPDSVAYLYEYEDDSDTTTFIDSVGSNNAIVSSGSPSYSSASATGTFGLSHTGGDGTVSSSSFDPASLGSTNGYGVHAQLNADNNSGYNGAVGIGTGTDETFGVTPDGNGNWEIFLQIGGSNFTLSSGVSINTSAYQSVYIEATDSQVLIDIDGTETIATPSVTPSNIGSVEARTGNRGDTASFDYKGLVDNFAICEDPLSDSELSGLRSR